MNQSQRKPAILFLSLVPIKIIALGMIVGPWVALYWSLSLGEEYLGLSADTNLFYEYSIYAVLLIVLILIVKSNVTITLPSIEERRARQYQSRLLKLSLCAFCTVLFLAGIPMLFDSMNRGDVRISLGILGPFYTFVIDFMLPASTCCNYFLYCYLGRRNIVRTLLIYAMIFASAFLTGYKSSVIMIFLPLVACLWPVTSFVKKLGIAVLAIASILGSHILVENFDGTLVESAEYNLARSTSVAAYGLLGAWEMSRTENLELMPLIANSLFGSHIAPVVISLLGGSHGQMSGDAAKLVTYEYYPDQDAAEAGSVNLTLTLFGELVLLFHWLWIIWLIVFIMVVKWALKLLKSKFYLGNVRIGVLTLVFIVFVILPIVASSGILTLIAMPTFVYLVSTYLFVSCVLPAHSDKMS